MAQLSSKELAIISEHPLKDGLLDFCTAFTSKHEKGKGVDTPEIVDKLTSRWPNKDTKNAILDLCEALLSQPAVRSLRSRISDGLLSRDVMLLPHLSSSEAGTKLVRPLLKAVLTGQSDVNIWAAVFDLTTSIRNATPPTAVEKWVLDTPCRSSSLRRSLEQKRSEINQQITEELRNCTYNDVKGFFDRYFQGKAWTDAANEKYERSKEWCEKDRWMEFPVSATKSKLLDWLQTFQDKFLAGLDRSYFTSNWHGLLGSERNQKLDHFLAPSDAVMSSGKRDWSCVLVIGVVKSNPDDDGQQDTLLQLAGYAREVFGAQPSRRFTHGYTLCGSRMRLYLFDRSGTYSSPNFDIHGYPKHFVRVLAGYALMSDEELGLNTFIKRDNIGSHIMSHRSKIYLEDTPIASKNGIVCRGTTCYRGKGERAIEWEYVVKFSWPSAKRRREGELLRLAKDRGVKGIARWVDHQDIVTGECHDTIANLRSGLSFQRPRQNSRESAWLNGPVGERSPSQTGEKGSLRGKLKKSASLPRGLEFSLISVATNSSRKRKRDVVQRESSSTKRRRLSDETPKPEPLEPETILYSNAQDSHPDSLMSDEDEPYEDRAYCCLIVSPAGRPFGEFHSIKEFLQVLRDAILAHKSLLIDGKILHRDISMNNIVIARGETPTGILIDLDLAKERGSSCRGAGSQTGTLQFMAIEVLEGLSHTFRHDLESFFYVFLWICVRHKGTVEDVEDSSSLESASRVPSEYVHWRMPKNFLRSWYSGTYDNIASMKRAHMEKGYFRKLVAEFSTSFKKLKPLAERLRSILFPITSDGSIFWGTPPASDTVKMYDRIIDAFDGAIRDL
ncbi:MAG: hypothetical protein M1824_001884 [Vezdaea acicularis]|nr:MAG: hypothetical protein M1824_001884 [Vezdaea acicularis]